MLTLGDETWLLWLITSAAAISFVAFLATCICGCRKTVPKNELMGLAGMVKITNPEESLNHNVGDHLTNESVPCTEIGGGRLCSDGTDPTRRTSTTANRSLPDIPVDSERVNLDSGDTLWESNEPNGDTCSELYATVEENKIALQPSVPTVGREGGGKHPVAVGGGPTSDDGKGSEHSSLSQTEDGFSPYAQLKSEHPYDQLKKSEHPYAQVGSGSDRNDKSDAPPGPPTSEKTNPVPPPRTRKSNSSNSSLIVTQDTVMLPSTSGNIAAATAIAGRISANQELPYMTPPIPTPAMVSDPQLHFSGDSQDSSKGYTSISVREPLANIKAQTRQRSRTQELSDSLYATVSDDSEEMYAAIEEPGPVYTSGSETYAQIQPPTVIPEPVSEPTETQHNPPQPPSVDSLKQVAHVHSRQASSSSAASSVTNLGSPKPEKRQANSPLPPPPADLYATVDKKTPKSLEEMYAKVMKKKQRGLSEDSTGTTGEPKAPVSDVESTDVSSSRESVEGRPPVDSDTTSTGDLEPPEPPVDPGYEVVARGGEPNYEELGGYASSTLPGYESIGRPRRPRPPPSEIEDPNYEVVRHDDPNYESVDYSDGLALDPPYERLHDSEYVGV